MVRDISLYIGAIALGLFSHMGIFIRGEWHLRILRVVCGHLILYCLVLALLRHDREFLSALYTSYTFMALYLISLFGSIITYRVRFHPIKNFPGPRLASVTKFWHVWKVRDCRNFLFLRTINEKYGDVVRTGNYSNDFELFQDKKLQLFVRSERDHNIPA